ncbi:tyrosine-type recombinase/integrase [Halorubellus sp. PRR65]|uniref:tyrosine-type recombinase/integrase n=1 Tax=Halorubellus sp. PRR65 TaxID=3098148 RepID=UPI002B25B008|nr:tyrosine-type recombinase/integrase [Halorubellus sp. PRR65]
MSDPTHPGETPDTAHDDAPPTRRWTEQDLSDMQQYFWRHIASDAGADGIDVETEKPTYSWLDDNGYRRFVAALRRHHDQPFDEFWSSLIAPDAAAWDYDWGTGDQRTIEALEHFLDRRASRYGLSESSVDTLRYRLNGYVRAFKLANDHARLLASVARDSDTPAYEAVDEVFAAFDHLNEANDRSDTTIKRIADIVDSFYSHLVSRQVAATNPAGGLDDEFKWDTTTDGDTPALRTEHVQALMDVVKTPADELLVIALAGWGLRANEVAALHVNQIDRDGDDVPRIEFDDRKNGPGSVSLLYGMEVLDDRLAQLSDRTAWNGYLFPSTRDDAAHISRQTVWRRFRDLADTAGLPDEIDGERPSPQLCRRFWYDRYSETLQDVIAGLEDIAAEQGSSDPEVVLNNYLSEDRARRLRRDAMRERLAAAFEAQVETADE